MQPAPCFKLHHRYLLVSEIPLEDLKNVPYFLGDALPLVSSGKPVSKPRYKISNINSLHTNTKMKYSHISTFTVML